VLRLFSSSLITTTESSQTCFQFANAKLFELSNASVSDPSLLPEAQRIQGIVARGDYTIAKASIAGTKFLLEKLYGYGGLPRKPLPPISSTAADALWAHPHVQELIKLERELSGKIAPAAEAKSSSA
jgi:4-hydroxy-2-oxoglutarate aldolase